jgi:hypothetical protein
MENVVLIKHSVENPQNIPSGAKILGYFEDEGYAYFVTRSNWENWVQFREERHKYYNDFCNYAMNVRFSSIYDPNLTELLLNYNEVKNSAYEKYYENRYQEIRRRLRWYGRTNSTYLETCKKAVIISIAKNVGLCVIPSMSYVCDGRQIYPFGGIYVYHPDNFINSVNYIYWIMCTYYTRHEDDDIYWDLERNFHIDETITYLQSIQFNTKSAQYYDGDNISPFIQFLNSKGVTEGHQLYKQLINYYKKNIELDKMAKIIWNEWEELNNTMLTYYGTKKKKSTKRNRSTKSKKSKKKIMATINEYRKRF